VTTEILIVDVNDAKPGDVGVIRAISETAPFFVGLHVQDEEYEDALPLVGREIQPAIRFPSARNVVVAGTFTLRLIVVDPR
jgi:hypothetical protein